MACVKIHYTEAESYTYVLPATSFCNVWWNAIRDMQEAQSLGLRFPLVLNSSPKAEKEMAPLNEEFSSVLIQRGKNNHKQAQGLNKNPTHYIIV